MGGKSATGMQHQYGATLAQTLYGRALGRSFQSSSWQDSQPKERQARSSDFGGGPTEAQGWLDALEYSEVGRRTWHQPYASRPCSGQSRTAAPPPFAATWPATTRILKPRLLTSLACI